MWRMYAHAGKRWTGTHLYWTPAFITIETNDTHFDVTILTLSAVACFRFHETTARGYIVRVRDRRCMRDFLSGSDVDTFDGAGNGDSKTDNDGAGMWQRSGDRDRLCVGEEEGYQRRIAGLNKGKKTFDVTCVTQRPHPCVGVVGVMKTASDIFRGRALVAIVHYHRI